MSAFGPKLEAGAVRFRLWAPDGGAIRVEVEGRGETEMIEAADGWKEALVACGPGSKYRFQMGDTMFPDPASRTQSGGVHGWSVVVPVRKARGWVGRPWRETVLYECHVGLMGGFQGVAAQLQRLAALGVTAIELMPLAAFPGARNWGYDGVLPFAPAEAYGTAEELCALIDQAHELGLMMFLDVVYNHFGPDGNYLPLYAKRFFRQDTPTPWGPAIDFRQSQVRQFFYENACMWVFDYGFDGLRFDAVHAIRDEGWLDQTAQELRQEAGERSIHLVLENDDNIASHLRHGPVLKRFDAQWNDDIHHVLHVLLTGETNGYYQDFVAGGSERLARALSEGFVYQGEASHNRHGATRGEPSADLPPTAFVAFLQNHDQTGNRALGERLTALADPEALRATVALLLLMPQIPMIFMGEEFGSRTPFLYFTDHNAELASAVKEGRAREFAAFTETCETTALPDPNDPRTFVQSRPVAASNAAEWYDLYRRLLALRHEHIIPRLDKAKPLGVEVAGRAAILARWQLDEVCLTIAFNLGPEAVSVSLPKGQPIWGAATRMIPPRTTLAWVET